MKERWLPVAGYEGVYSVSDRGRVRREVSRTYGKAGKILKPTANDTYPCVDLCKDGVRRKRQVHQIVAEAFLGPCPPGMNVNHKNARKHDPRLSNLEYGTQQHNVKEAYRLKRRDCRGAKNGKAILTTRRVRAIRKAYTGARGEQSALARKYGVSPTTIRGIVSGRDWSHV